MGMNCDNCKYYNWYYDYCDKWKCEVDEREVHPCYKHRRKKVDKTNKKENHLKVEYKLDEIRQYLDSNLHPLISPDNWQVYSDLIDMIDELGELIEEDE